MAKQYWGLAGRWESLAFPWASTGLGETGLPTSLASADDVPAGETERARTPRVSTGEGDRAVEMNEGSLSLCIVAHERRGTDPQDPSVSQGGGQINGSYRAPPVKRVYIPKGNGEQRDIGIPTYEDKILQRAVVMLLEPIYEEAFHDFSFGFRPGKSPHHALEYLREQCYRQEVSYILDVDVRKCFDTIDHGHLREILNARVRDGVIRRLIDKWLPKAGVWEKGHVYTPETGSPQGGVISPLLSNIYLHTILDDWYVTEIKEQLKGNNVVQRKTSGKSFSRSLKAIKEWGWKHRHLPLREQQEQINRKLTGHYGYYGITGNIRSLKNLRFVSAEKVA